MSLAGNGGGVVARHRELVIRAMTADPADVAQMLVWLTDERVLEWFEGRDQVFDLERVRTEFALEGPADAADGLQRCLIEGDGRPIGYIQFFNIAGYAGEYQLDPIDAQQTWAIDLFIGEPARWGTGLGTRVVSLMIEHLFVNVGAERVVIDPRVINARAIRSYEKAGFTKVKVLAGHEMHEGRAWDGWLMAIDALDHPVGLTARLARINSVNPSLVPGAPGEVEVAEFVAVWAAARGLDVERTEVAPGRHNVVVVRHGSGGGRSLLFNAHLDTVGVGSAVTADVRLLDGRLYGRGVLDTKGGLAAALLAAASIGHHELAGDLIVAGVADEEFASIGTEALITKWSPEAAVVLEPTNMAVITEHRGFAVLEAVIEGCSTHTSTPERGTNAAHAAAAATMSLAALDAEWSSTAPAGTMRPAVLVSGVRTDGETFTVPAACVITAEVRTVGVDARGRVAQHQIREVVGAIEQSVNAAGASVRLSVIVERPPLNVDRNHHLVTSISEATTACAAAPPLVTWAPYWTDAALHAAVSTPSLVFGPMGEGLHEASEWVTTSSLHQCTRILAETARRWCGHPSTTAQ